MRNPFMAEAGASLAILIPNFNDWESLGLLLPELDRVVAGLERRVFPWKYFACAQIRAISERLRTTVQPPSSAPGLLTRDAPYFILSKTAVFGAAQRNSTVARTADK